MEIDTNKDYLYYIDALEVYILVNDGESYMIDGNKINSIDITKIERRALLPIKKDRYQPLTFKLLFGDK